MPATSQQPAGTGIVLPNTPVMVLLGGPAGARRACRVEAPARLLRLLQPAAAGRGKPNRSGSTQARIWSSSCSSGSCQVASSSVKAAIVSAVACSEVRPASAVRERAAAMT
jgi:hypothetical protein